MSMKWNKYLYVLLARLSPLGLLQQNTTDWVAFKQRKCTCHSLEAGSPKPRHQHRQVPGEDPFLAHSWPLFAVPSYGGRG